MGAEQARQTARRGEVFPIVEAGKREQRPVGEDDMLPLVHERGDRKAGKQRLPIERPVMVQRGARRWAPRPLGTLAP